MTPDAFRRIALSMPEAVEASHMGHPDFRVGRKIFATVGWPDRASAMVKLTPEQQATLAAAEPAVFVPVPGGWGRRGSTNVRLAAADATTVRSALAMAWRNVAPKSVVKRIDGGQQRTAAGTANPSAGDLDHTIARIRTALAAAKLPEVEEGKSFGTFAIKVRGKFLMRVKDPDTLVFRCLIEEKGLLIEAAPDIYFETDHYKGWPGVLVRLSKIDDRELAHCFQRAWRLQAPAQLVAQREGKIPATAKQRRRAG
jgi:hypothetical protein